MDVAAQMADQWAKEDKKETSRNKSDESLGNLINGKYLYICTEVAAHLKFSLSKKATNFATLLETTLTLKDLVW